MKNGINSDNFSLVLLPSANEPIFVQFLPFIEFAIVLRINAFTKTFHVTLALLLAFLLAFSSKI